MINEDVRQEGETLTQWQETDNKPLIVPSIATDHYGARVDELLSVPII